MNEWLVCQENESVSEPAEEADGPGGPGGEGGGAQGVRGQGEHQAGHHVSSLSTICPLSMAFKNKSTPPRKRK